MYDANSTELITFHSGKLTGLDTSPCRHFAATTAEDGRVRVYDYVGQKLLATSSFSAGGTVLSFAPQTVDPSGRTVAVGFADGVIRVLAFKEEGELQLLQAIKPHSSPVVALQYSPDGEYLASCAKDGTIFFFFVHHFAPVGTCRHTCQYLPLLTRSVPGFVQCSQGRPSDLTWAANSKTVLVTCETNTLLEFAAPAMGVHDVSSSYELRGACFDFV